MKWFETYGYKVYYCRDINEWATEFYGKTDDMEIDKEQIPYLESECMGFANPDNNEIWIFMPIGYDILDLEATIAHEVGHCASDTIMMMFNKLSYGGENAEKFADHFHQYYFATKAIYNVLKSYK